MDYSVILRKSAFKSLEKLPLEVQQKFNVLFEILKFSGPTGPHNWTNYGKLKGQKNRYHCHLSRSHAYVVCWEYYKEVITIEIYYVGHHKDAPY